LVPPKGLEKLLNALLDEKEFLAPGGIRSLSKIHEIPYSLNIGGQHFGLNYQPAESTTFLFGGNSNWRGPVWFPMNYLLILSLETFGTYYKNSCQLEFPVGSGKTVNLNQAAFEISRRLISIFKKDDSGNRPVNNNDVRYQNDPYFKDLILFYEFFHGDSSRGAGASHQTGWTGLIAELINRVANHD
ncbi:MAG: MGH1-like glycoside hydrolase domain-containing protein, partial [Chitinophagaceae bacterium]